MYQAQQVILIEFNELCPALLAKWMRTGDLPNFERFYRSSQAFITKSDEVEPINLEPWIQWYSIHTGIPFSEHRVFNLTDGPLAGHKDIWQVLADAGKSVINCGSMNAKRIASGNSLFIPDPWCTSQSPNPEEIESYYAIISRMVQEYSNKDQGLTVREKANFLRFMLTHGLTLKTIGRIVEQLAQDWTSGGKTRWKRATVLDRLQYDVFRHYFHSRQPSFSTFFLNSTAHYQHSYWRHMEPEAFTARPTQTEIEQLGGAILFGYQEMDRLLGEFLKLAGPGVVLTLASGISQQPFLRHESAGGQRFFRPRNIEAFLKVAGIEGAVAVEPIMTHQFVIRFHSPLARDAALTRLERIRVEGKPVFGFGQADERSICFGASLVNTPRKESKVSVGDRDYDFLELFYQIDVSKSGCHHPDGLLWIRTGAHAVIEHQTSILDIFPTVLDLLNIPVAEVAPQTKGRSLVPAFQ